MAQQIVAEKIIRIDVVTSAAAQRNIQLLATEVKKVEANTSKLADSLDKGFGNFGNVISKVAGALGALGFATSVGALAKQALDAASAYQVLEGRLKQVLGTQEAANKATNDVINIARETGREIDGVSKLYEKASRSAKQFGLSQDDVRQITLGFSQSIRLSGASTQEAYASLVQFGQALASGRLQGDEFRSLLENNSVFMYEFAKAAGVTISELRKMGTEGKLNAELLFKTMLKEGADGLNMMQRLAKMAENMPLSFAQSFESLKTQATQFTGELAKLFNLQSEDKLGPFGFLIRKIQELTEKIKLAEIEAKAANEGYLGRLFRTLKIGAENIKDSGLNPFGIGTLSGLIAGKDSEKGEAGAMNRLKDSAARNQELLNATDATLAKLEIQKQKLIETGKDVPESLNERISRLSTLAGNYVMTLKDIARAQEELGNFDDPRLARERRAGTPTPGKPDPTTEQKNATKNFQEYIAKLREAVDAEKLVRDGRFETMKQSKEYVELLDLAKKAGVSQNSEAVKRGIADIKEVASMKERREEKEKLLKFQEKEFEQQLTANQKIEEAIKRDEAAIQAIRNKTKATQEYTTAKEEEELAAARAAQFVTDNADPYAEFLRNRIALLETAIAKRKELEDAQGDARAAIANSRTDKEKEREVKSTADEIRNSLKRGLNDRNNDIGTQLWENIRDTFRSKVIDIVFNPILDPISRALAQIALDFGNMLSIKIAESMANKSADPIGTLINLLPGIGGAPKPSAAVGIDRVPYDGFLASLHHGERVQTAQEANDWRSGRSKGMGAGLSINPSYTFHIDSRSDQESVRAATQEAVAQGNLQLVEELRARGAIA